MNRRIPDTSRLAAELNSARSASQRRRVYDWIAAHGPATRDVICDALGMDGNSLRPRVRELLDRGYVRVVDAEGRTRTGRRAERLMITGRPYIESTPPRPAVQLQLPLQA